MAEVRTYSCDVAPCAATRKDSDFWFEARIIGRAILVTPLGATQPGALYDIPKEICAAGALPPATAHICGIECLQKWLATKALAIHAIPARTAGHVVPLNQGTQPLA